ncbi:Protein of unknown function [Pyronema omphalodes CBS 100304]|uniref:Uncharacterized protein n=1 Tax=Pyronema omphalodes (strain CBS 100304) TaxID=1076935 RepID=U4LRV4_PYROM|nr:Protein of unknown function [Pyronema omphalodes CBS 100304]
MFPRNIDHNRRMGPGNVRRFSLSTELPTNLTLRLSQAMAAADNGPAPNPPNGRGHVRRFSEADEMIYNPPPVDNPPIPPAIPPANNPPRQQIGPGNVRKQSIVQEEPQYHQYPRPTQQELQYNQHPGPNPAEDAPYPNIRTEFTPTPPQLKRYRDVEAWNAAYEDIYGPPPVYTLYQNIPALQTQYNPLYRPEARHPDDVFGPDYSVNPANAAPRQVAQRMIPSQTLPYPMQHDPNYDSGHIVNPRIIVASQTLPVHIQQNSDHDDDCDDDDDDDNRTIYPASNHTVGPSSAAAKHSQIGLAPDNRKNRVNKTNAISPRQAVSNQRMLSSQTLPVYTQRNIEDEDDDMHLLPGLTGLEIGGERHRDDVFRMDDHVNTTNGIFFQVDNSRMMPSQTLPVGTLYNNNRNNIDAWRRGCAEDVDESRYDSDGFLIDSDEEQNRNVANERQGRYDADEILM